MEVTLAARTQHGEGSCAPTARAIRLLGKSCSNALVSRPWAGLRLAVWLHGSAVGDGDYLVPGLANLCVGRIEIVGCFA